MHVIEIFCDCYEGSILMATQQFVFLLKFFQNDVEFHLRYASAEGSLQGFRLKEGVEENLCKHRPMTYALVHAPSSKFLSISLNVPKHLGL